MKIQATFTGRDSLGYQHGIRYTLNVLNTKPVLISRAGSAGSCIYASLAAFLRNWSDIVVIES